MITTKTRNITTSLLSHLMSGLGPDIIPLTLMLVVCNQTVNSSKLGVWYIKSSLHLFYSLVHLPPTPFLRQYSGHSKVVQACPSSLLHKLKHFHSLSIPIGPRCLCLPQGANPLSQSMQIYKKTQNRTSLLLPNKAHIIPSRLKISKTKKKNYKYVKFTVLFFN